LQKVFKIGVLVALLAGCQTTGQTPGGETGTVSGVGEAAKPTGKMAATPQVIRFNAAEFNGFSPERVLPVLGAPDFVRRDGNAQIWQYRTTNCVLDLFLYKNGGASTVKHAELRPRVPGAEPLDACYSRLRQERRTQPTG
jgi:hypothetical protein